MNALDEVAQTVETKMEIGAPAGMKDTWPRTRVIPLAAYVM
jgi:hypothetical protein